MSGDGSSGAGSDIRGRSVEVFLPSTGQHCQLADLPARREWHSMEGLLLCGGSYILIIMVVMIIMRRRITLVANMPISLSIAVGGGGNA